MQTVGGFERILEQLGAYNLHSHVSTNQKNKLEKCLLLVCQNKPATSTFHWLLRKNAPDTLYACCLIFRMEAA